MHVVAIDGPAGAGKSTLARALAEQLGWKYLDSGSFYRAVAVQAIYQGVALSDARPLTRIATISPFTHPDGRVTHVAGRNVEAAIRSAEASQAASAVSVYPGVRRAVTARLQRYSQEVNLVAEGRDMGTVVFPDATLKVFLTATPRERALRRQAEAGGDIDEIEAAIAARDLQDSTRHHSPLKPASDAVLVDTSGLTVPEVVAGITALLTPRL